MFMTEYHRIDQKQLFRNPYPLPRISKKMQKLEGLQQENALDINMGYYTISLLPDSQGMTKIVTEFGKFKYNSLPMGMCTLGDIFQVKVDQLLYDIKYVKTHINDLLVLSKERLSKQIEQLRIIFGYDTDAFYPFEIGDNFQAC